MEFGPDDEEEEEEEELRNYTEPTIVEASNEGTEDDTLNQLLSSPRMSYKRYSNQSDKRISIASLRVSERSGMASNRSSTTIKPHSSNVKRIDDADFENALRNFAAERETFLLDLNTSAGVVQKQSKPRPKTQRIVSDDGQQLKSGLGSVRRRISFREMTSIRRQPSIARQGKC